MNRFGLVALAALVVGAPMGAAAQVDPMGLVTSPSTAPRASASAPAATPSSCGRSARPYLPSFGPPPAGFPAVLWPDADQCEYTFGALEFTAGAAQKKAFANASRVPCGDCEGGYSYDSWANYFTEKDGSKSAFDAKVAALPIGKSISWKGRKHQGEIVATGERPIGSTPCKQYHWTMRLAGKVVAEREGLFCQIDGKWREKV